jgi:two-component system phosphate regulon sensor histidine kinase PhoR
MIRKFYHLIIAFIVLITIIFVLLYLTSVNEIRQDGKLANANFATKMILTQMDQYIRDNDFIMIDKLLTDIGKETGYKIALLIDGDFVTASSDNFDEIDSSFASYPVEINDSELTFAINIQTEDIFSWYNLSDILIPYLLLFMLLVAILFIVLRKLFTPFNTIRNVIASLASGESLNYLSLKGKTYQPFADDFNAIAEQLNRYETELSEQIEGFNAIIESIQEPVWIQDSKGIISYSNQSFRELVGYQKVVGLYFWNIIRIPNLYEFVDKLHQNPQNQIKELEAHSKIYICSASQIRLTGEIVFILQDITELRKLAIIKKDFVLNISHELRTPLTAIKGFLETMEEELPAESQTYLEVIKRNTERLIRIVQDLLTLSKLEHSHELELEELDLAKLVSNIISIFDDDIKKKGLKIAVDLEEDIPKISLDRFKIEQVFINLIDNAIKYTEEGEISISITKLDRMIHIVVSDSGIGIAKQHLARIFERFYVVDKSRSRRMSSTGLGLAIVKHIVYLHKGTISVNSEPEEGTKFHIKFPMNL